VRGVKSGLPLSDCLQIIAAEAPEPVRGEFVDLVEQQKVGVPLSRAFERMSERMPLQEVNFFAIVIAIQAQTGGNSPRRWAISPPCCATVIACRPRTEPSAPRPRRRP
jgi:Flp pilus assembly protein TadB